MKVPKYIQARMHKAAAYAQKMNDEMRIVDAWFERNGYDSDVLRSGDGYSLEELEYGNDITDVFCEEFEAGKYDKEEAMSDG